MKYIKVVIFAGGFGTRLSEETGIKPKPMVEIGSKPILWHIMKIYSAYGFNDFIICLGYKGYAIKEYFANYFLHQSDITIDVSKNKIKVHNSSSEPWKITLVDTGVKAMTGARLKRVEEHIENETFMLTYGDGVADIDVSELLRFHKSHGKLATITGIQPETKFGTLCIENNEVKGFKEKPKSDDVWVNGGFFVLEPEIFKYIGDGDNATWEQEALEEITKSEQLMVYKHIGFWKCMDTLNDKNILSALWDSGNAPWFKKR